MATNMPRISLALPEDLLQRINDYRWQSRAKNQTQSIIQLIEKGLTGEEVPPQQDGNQSETHDTTARMDKLMAFMKALELAEALFQEWKADRLAAISELEEQAPAEDIPPIFDAMRSADDGIWIGRRIQAIRKAQHLTQEELDNRLGVGRTTVTMWETGSNTPPTKYLMAIAQALNCTVDTLLNDTD